MQRTKGTDQPAHLRRLISPFVVPCLDSITTLLAISEISRPLLASGLSLTLLQTSKDRFSNDVAHILPLISSSVLPHSDVMYSLAS